MLLNVELHNPDVVCVVESWLSTEIQNSEIHIPGYFIVRLDRNRHGGGVIMFIRNKFTIKQLLPCPPLELITVTLHCDVYRFCLSLLYRPPSLSVDVFGVLQHYYESINVSQFCSYVIIGDFNVNVLNSSGFMFHNYNSFISFFGLTQVVDHPTHLVNGHSHSLIDLVLVSNLLYLYSCLVIPSLANSDHLGVLLQMKLKVSLKPVCPPRRNIWLYSQANWTKACELMPLTGLHFFQMT